MVRAVNPARLDRASASSGEIVGRCRPHCQCMAPIGRRRRVIASRRPPSASPGPFAIGVIPAPSARCPGSESSITIAKTITTTAMGRPPGGSRAPGETVRCGTSSSSRTVVDPLADRVQGRRPDVRRDAQDLLPLAIAQRPRFQDRGAGPSGRPTAGSAAPAPRPVGPDVGAQRDRILGHRYDPRDGRADRGGLRRIRPRLPRDATSSSSSRRSGCRPGRPARRRRRGR